MKSYNKWLKLADLNLATVIKNRMKATPHSILLEQNQQISFSIGQPSLGGHLNGIFRYGEHSDTQQINNLCNEFLNLLGFGFIFWIRDHADYELEKKIAKFKFVTRAQTWCCWHGH